MPRLNAKALYCTDSGSEDWTDKLSIPRHILIEQPTGERQLAVTRDVADKKFRKISYNNIAATYLWIVKEPGNLLRKLLGSFLRKLLATTSQIAWKFSSKTSGNYCATSQIAWKSAKQTSSNNRDFTPGAKKTNI